MAEAISCHRARNWSEAEQRYRAILAVQPSHPDANHNLGVLAVQVGRPEIGLLHLKSALESNPSSGQYWLSYADGLLVAGKVSEAQVVLERAIQKGLAGPPVDALLARIKDRQSPSAAATSPDPSPPGTLAAPKVDVAAAPKVDKATRRKVASLHAQALRFAQTGKPARAERLCREILSLDAGHAESWGLLCGIALQSGRMEVAADLGARAVALKPDYHDAQYNLGAALNALGRREEALRCYEQALALKPDHVDTLISLGSVLQDLGRTDEAIARQEQALAIKPKLPGALYNLGNALEARGDKDLAIARYQQALALKPNYFEALSTLGGVLTSKGRMDEAIACYERALSIRPNLPKVLNNLSQVQFHKGTLTAAVRNCLAALRGSGVPIRESGDLSSWIAMAVRDLPSDYRFTADQEEYVSNLLLCELHANGIDDWSAIVEPLMRFRWSPDVRFGFLVNRLIGDWATGDLEKLPAVFAECDRELLSIDTRQGPRFVGNGAYYHFINGLLKHALASPGVPQGPIVSVVGDSHSLSFMRSRVELGGHSFVAKAQLVMGGKAWHLANDAYTRHKQRFEWAVARAPERSTVLCSFGEIDCRINEGILPFWRRRGGSLDDLLRKQTSDYVAYVSGRLSLREQVPVFLGVPAPFLDSPSYQFGDSTLEDRELLVQVIRTFNECLKQAASDRGFMFVDFYALTNDREGKASGRFHIDTYHLRPEALALALALDQG